MAKKRKRGQHKPGSPPSQVRADDPLMLGLRAFQAGQFETAIKLWKPLVQTDPRAAAALAQAHFRYAMTTPDDALRLVHLRAAVRHNSQNILYRYHLGLAFHLRNRLPEAIDCYQQVLARDPDRPNVQLVLGLAQLEQDHTIDLTQITTAPEVIAELAPIQALLTGAPLTTLPADPARAQLWRGLYALQTGSGNAATLLGDHRPLASTLAITIRRAYLGVALAQQNDFQAAFAAWEHIQPERFDPPWLEANRLSVLHPVLQAAAEAGQADRMAAAALAIGTQAASHAGLTDAVLQVLDQAAHRATAAGNWEQAITYWEAARDLLAARSSAGSPRPLYHNLALAYEALEDWAAAADAWRAMLRTQPRTPSSEPAPGEFSAAHWTWVRRRVIECYKRADMPGQAVTLFRSMVKADPDNRDLRLELAEALLANEQVQAAFNEFERIIGLDPTDSTVYIRRAALFLVYNDLKVAEHDLRIALKYAPDSAQARRMLAEVLLRYAEQSINFQRYAAARTYLDEGRALDPDNYRLLSESAFLYIQEGQIDTALPLLDQALALGASDPMIYFSVIDCFLLLEDIERANAALATAQATLSLAMGFYMQLLESIMPTISPPYPNLMLGASQAAAAFTPPPATPVTDFVHTILAAAVRLDPENPETYEWISDILYIDRPDLALPYARQAVERNPQDATSRITLALTLALLNQVPEAKQQLHEAERLAQAQRDGALMAQISQLRLSIEQPGLYLSLRLGRMIGPASMSSYNDMFIDSDLYFEDEPDLFDSDSYM